MKQKLVIDKSRQELTEKIHATLAAVLKDHAAKNLPIVYRNSLCVKKNQFIHEYADGKKFLIQQNITNSEETILQQF